MSQSPTVRLPADAQDTLKEYKQGWQDLNNLLRQGGSLSGREQNCCYLNLGDVALPRFVDVSHVSGFDQPMDGRAIAIVDWDGDGDLDVWTSNRTGPRFQFFRNQADPQRHFVSIRLQGTDGNRDAIGARVEVEVEPALGTLSRTVVAGDAYLSQSSKWLHFGLSDRTKIKSTRVRWPGSSTFKEITGIQADGAYRVVQGEAVAEPIHRQLATDPVRTSDHVLDTNSHVPETTSKTIISGRIPLPPIDLTFIAIAEHAPKPGQTALWLLWSPDCPNCTKELKHFAANASRLRKAGLEVLAIAPAIDETTDQKARSIIEKTEFPFAWGVARPRELKLIETYLGFLQQDYQRPIVVPTSLLIDSAHQVVTIYRGTVRVTEVIEDLHHLNQPSLDLRAASAPFPGTWLLPFRRPAAHQFASELRRQFGTQAAVAYFEHLLSTAERVNAAGDTSVQIPAAWIGQALHALGAIALSEGQYDNAEQLSLQAQTYLPQDFRVFANHGAALLKLNRHQEALPALNLALELRPSSESALENRATLLTKMGQRRAALRDWEALLSIKPQHDTFRLTAAALAFAMGDDRRSASHYRQYLVANPNSQDAKTALAWVLATSQDESVRNGPQAVALVGDLRPDRDYKLLNIQAAAWAAVGEFNKALFAIQRAIELARSLGDGRAAAAYQSRRQLYQVRQPFRRGD